MNCVQDDDALVCTCLLLRGSRATRAPFRSKRRMWRLSCGIATTPEMEDTANLQWVSAANVSQAKPNHAVAAENVQLSVETNVDEFFVDCRTTNRTYLLMALSVLMVVIGERMFFRSHTFTVLSSDPDTTLSPCANTAVVTGLQNSNRTLSTGRAQTSKKGLLYSCSRCN